jgi:hypothetical protein
MAGAAERLFFYIPFTINDASMIACGFAYNGEHPHKWDRAYCVDIIGLETGWSPAEVIKCWNHQVHLWLKHYVQARIVDPGMRPTLG